MSHRNIVTPAASGKFGREITDDYNVINVLEMESVKQAKLEMWIAKRMGDVLVSNYPNREWGVRVDLFGGMVIITCDSLDLERGFHIKLEGRNIHDLQHQAKMAGGEILERHGISRNRKFDPEELLNAGS